MNKTYEYRITVRHKSGRQAQDYHYNGKLAQQVAASFHLSIAKRMISSIQESLTWRRSFAMSKTPAKTLTTSRPFSGGVES